MIRRQIIAITGASGAEYALRLLWHLSGLVGESDLIYSPSFLKVLKAELGIHLDSMDAAVLLKLAAERYGAMPTTHKFTLADYANISARAASGSAAYTAMVILPCSMKTLAAIANGLSQNLIERAADVSLKERRTLILCPRETPLSTIHLRNMLSLSQAGATIMPLMPGYYHRPDNIESLLDFMVDRVLTHLGYAERAVQPWGS